MPAFLCVVKRVIFRAKAFGNDYDDSKQGKIKGFYRQSTRGIGLIRSRIESLSDARKTLRHETLAYFGLDLLPDSDRKFFLAAIARSRKVSGVRQVFDQVEALCPQLANDKFEQAGEVFTAVVDTGLYSHQPEIHFRRRTLIANNG